MRYVPIGRTDRITKTDIARCRVAQDCTAVKAVWRDSLDRSTAFA